ETVALFEAEGVATKVEETGKVFPVSNRARDVLDALLRRLDRSGAVLATSEPLRELAPGEGGWVITTPTRTIRTQRAILLTGGQSSPGSGTAGDGYAVAIRLGHTIVTPRPALVPITTTVSWVGELRGVTLPDVAVRIFEGDRALAVSRGS